jgi:cathepsin A (carboxypeptidase C)
LTGGPGCSSTLALLTENGPCKVAGDGSSTTVNPYSWTEAAHVLWLDQPAGVGFSYGAEDDSNEAMISEDAFYFLQAFFQTNPDYARSPLYIVGESYGTLNDRHRYSLSYAVHLVSPFLITQSTP